MYDPDTTEGQVWAAAYGAAFVAIMNQVGARTKHLDLNKVAQEARRKACLAVQHMIPASDAYRG